ncbi:class I SAM-dependent methyltransferase [Rhizobium lusitanum]|uniref:class I SAM-dependent methyltransferase n=1 Tax=Rhizobium lusitanum TaxID=293958 RepID=UPI0016139A40|nr:class I SAM-dependent methyltransferase [Rhizobium lusitanum]
MNIGRLYDQRIAETYDDDERGLLAGARALALEQISKHVTADQTQNVLDLAVGTGESLIAIEKNYPNAALHGIDLSGEMLRIAKAKLGFHAVHDDVANTLQHFSLESMNLILMHFLTTFIDGEDIVARTAKLLQAKGYYSIVSSTFQAFPRVYSLARTVLPDQFIRDKNRAPEDADTIVSFCAKAGLDVVAVEHFTKEVRFANFDDFYSFGLNSGFFAHVLCHLDVSQLATFSRMEGVFPLTDHYRACAVLARLPE